MKTRQLLLGATLFFLSSLAGESSNPDDPVKVVLTAEKAVYRLGEAITFNVTITNSSPDPVKVLVRLYDWEDLAKMDAKFNEARERAKIDPRWADMVPPENLAGKARSEGQPHPLGDVGCVNLNGPKTGSGVAGFDIDSTSCGTFQKNGMMPAGTECKYKFTIGPKTRWGPPGTYRYVWRAAQPLKKKNQPVGKLNAISNPVDITLTE